MDNMRPVPLKLFVGVLATFSLLSSASRAARAGGRSLVQNDNAWYSYCFSSSTSSCPPCDLYPSFPCQNDDSDGQDARICSLPEFYGGNVPDDSICGAGSTPFNLGQASINTVVDGQSLTVGNMYQSMDLSGVWRGTVQLTCPFMMRLDLGQGYNIQLQVSNSDGRSWRSWTNSSSYGRPYRTCTSWSLPMETSLPCKPNNITLTASLFVVETTALGTPDAATCHQPSPVLPITSSMWYIPMAALPPSPPPTAPLPPLRPPSPPTPFVPDTP
ncbi:hypothetical protein V8C86DRAFT_2589416 [Haematococcus lacustris]